MLNAAPTASPSVSLQRFRCNGPGVMMCFLEQEAYRFSPRGGVHVAALTESDVEDAMEPERIAPVEVKLRMETGEAVAFLDSRSDEAWQKAEWQIPNS